MRQVRQSVLQDTGKRRTRRPGSMPILRRPCPYLSTGWIRERPASGSCSRNRTRFGETSGRGKKSSARWGQWRSKSSPFAGAIRVRYPRRQTLCGGHPWHRLFRREGLGLLFGARLDAKRHGVGVPPGCQQHDHQTRCDGGVADLLTAAIPRDSAHYLIRPFPHDFPHQRGGPETHCRGRTQPRPHRHGDCQRYGSQAGQERDLSIGVEY